MILIFQRMIPHYRIDIFKLIHKATNAIICFGKKGMKNTFLIKREPNFPHLKIFDWYPFPKKDTFVFLDIFTPLFKFKPDILIIEFALAIISNYILLLLRPFFNYKIILWSHGYNRKYGFNPSKTFTDKLRLWWMNKADAIILYNNKGKKLISPYLKNKNKIFIAYNTLNTKKFLKLRNKFEKTGITNLKKELGIKSKYNLIFIGRLLQEKEPSQVIEVFTQVLPKINNCILHFVGDGPMRDELILLTKKYKIEKKVRFWGNITDEKLSGKLLYISDLMIIPGYIGLSAVHSFCFDTPVVTFKQGINGPFHSPEIEYVIHRKTGFLINYKNIKKMKEVILEYLNNKKLQKNMKEEIRYMVKNVCSIDKMIKGIIDAIEYVRK